MTDTPTKGTAALGQTIEDRIASLDLQQVDVNDNRAARLTAPVIQDAFVIYLGADPKHSRAFVGRVVNEEEPVEDKDGQPVLDRHGYPVTRILSSRTMNDDSVQAYDFSQKDAKGRHIRSRLWKKGSPEIVGKPFTQVQHAEHLRLFYMARDNNGAFLYRLMMPPASRALWESYAQEKNRRLSVERRQTEETVAA